MSDFDMFSVFLTNVGYEFVNSRGNLRYGQVCFNELYNLDEDLANSIRATQFDPFYDNARVPEFLTRLRDEWQ